MNTNYTALQRTALLYAADLNDGDSWEDHNEEYVRGQAELICSMFGIDLDEAEEVAKAILDKASKGVDFSEIG